MRADGASTGARAAWAVARFQLGGAVRLAVRSGVPVAAAATVAIGLSPDPGAALAATARGVADPDAGSAVPWVLAAVSFGLAAWGAPRIAHGADGWIRHLPLSEAWRRRAVLLALVAAQAPAILAAWTLWWIGWSGGAAVHPLRLVLPLALAIGFAILVLPVRRRIIAVSFGLAGVAAIVLYERTWAMPFVALGAAAAWERLAPPLGRARRRLAPTRAEVGGAVAFSFRVAWRVLLRRVAVSWLLALVPLAAVVLFVVNNPERSGAGAARFGGTLAVTVVLADLAERLSTHRPPWSWARALPWSALQRVSLDAACLALATVPVVLLVAAIDVSALVPVAAAAGALAVVAAGAVRGNRDARFGSWGPVAGYGAFFAACSGAFGGFVWIMLAMFACMMLPDGVRRERDLRPSTWAARHHLAEGDPMSWRGR